MRVFGDRFISCETPDGIRVNISGARTNEKMGDGDATAHWGLEHFGIDVDDVEAEIERLKALGAESMEGPHRCSQRASHRLHQGARGRTNRDLAIPLNYTMSGRVSAHTRSRGPLDRSPICWRE